MMCRVTPLIVRARQETRTTAQRVTGLWFFEQRSRSAVGRDKVMHPPTQLTARTLAIPRARTVCLEAI